jgi:hypothetical protein
MTVSEEIAAGRIESDGETCRVLGCGARLNGKRLAWILGAEGVVAAAMGIVVAASGIHEAGTGCATPWFGTSPGWGGIRIGSSGIAWGLVVSTAALFVLAVLLLVAAATAWRPPLDPNDRRVALTASLIAGQPFIIGGVAIAVILLLPMVTANATIGSADTGWHWFDEALLLVAVIVGVRVGWRACIAASSAPHRTQIIGGIVVGALLVFIALEAAGVTRVAGGGVAPTVSPGSFLSHSPLVCLR